MKNTYSIILAYWILFIILAVVSVVPVHAQVDILDDPLVQEEEEATEEADRVTPTPVLEDPEGTAEYIPVQGTVEPNRIVILTESGYGLSTKPYEEKIVGIVGDEPSVEINMLEQEDTYPVLVSGKASVEVTTENGPIQRGDMITSSSEEGIGMKATEPGFVVGSALEDFDGSDTGTVDVLISLKYSALGENTTPTEQETRVHLSDIFNISKVAASNNPVLVLRYLAAGLVIVATFAITFFTFERIANNGLRALGRNPMAGKLIGLGILLNVVVAGVMIAVGLFVAYVILIA
jgi:hypothetical protein